MNGRHHTGEPCDSLVAFEGNTKKTTNEEREREEEENYSKVRQERSCCLRVSAPQTKLLEALVAVRLLVLVLSRRDVVDADAAVLAGEAE